MSLATAITDRDAQLRTFRAALQREESAWNDRKRREIEEAFLAPLLSQNERFNRELGEIAAAVTNARRRLTNSR